MENNEIAKWLDNEIAEATKFRKNEVKEAEFNYWLGATDALEYVKRKFFESISSSPPSPAIDNQTEKELIGNDPLSWAMSELRGLPYKFSLEIERVAGLLAAIRTKRDSGTGICVCDRADQHPAPAIEGKEETLYTYYELDLEGCSPDWNTTICESLDHVRSVLQFLDTDLDDEDGKARITIRGIGMTREAYSKWQKENDVPPFAPTPPAGAEGGGEIKKAPRQIKPRHITERELSAAQAKIAELQARVNELQEWHDSHK